MQISFYDLPPHESQKWKQIWYSSLFGSLSSVNIAQPNVFKYLDCLCIYSAFDEINSQQINKFMLNKNVVQAS